MGRRKSHQGSVRLLRVSESVPALGVTQSQVFGSAKDLWGNIAQSGELPCWHWGCGALWKCLSSGCSSVHTTATTGCSVLKIWGCGELFVCSPLYSCSCDSEVV